MPLLIYHINTIGVDNPIVKHAMGEEEEKFVKYPFTNSEIMRFMLDEIVKRNASKFSKFKFTSIVLRKRIYVK